MKLSFTPLPGDYAVTRLPSTAPVPDWFDGPGLTSCTRTDDELSIVCQSDRVPNRVDAGWTAFRVDTLAALDEPGVVLAAVAPISNAGLGVFVISTHLRDYLLVRAATREQVWRALTDAGHHIE